MIVFDLCCSPEGHRFEGWFRSSDDFARQSEAGLLFCPECGTEQVGKAVSAARLARKGNQLSSALAAPARGPTSAETAPASATPVASAPVALPPEAGKLIEALARMQAEALKSSRFVGPAFAEKARAMHYGEDEVEVIHGQASAEEARDLIDEGIAVAPLLFPLIPPEKAN